MTDGSETRPLGGQMALVTGGDAEFSQLDILVNNAGGVARKWLIDQSERSWRNHIDLNMVSWPTATWAAVPLMIRGRGGGTILNVTSIEGARAAPGTILPVDGGGPRADGPATGRVTTGS